MRPYQTLALLAVIIAIALFMHFRSQRPDSRIDRLANCYVELAILHMKADTTSATFIVQRDSVLSSLGLTEQSLHEMKSQLEQDPEKLIDVWDLVDKKLKARKEATDIIKQ